MKITAIFHFYCRQYLFSRQLVGFLRPILIFAFLIAIIQHSSSQRLNSYKGPYETLTGIKGNAQFQFTEKGDIHIKNGYFRFNSRSRRLVDGQTRLEEVVWAGDYENDIKVGGWAYETKTHILELLDVEGFEPQYELQSEIMRLEASFDADGNAQDEWVYDAAVYKNGKQTGGSLSVALTFKKGKAEGQVKIFNTTSFVDLLSIVGKAENGLMQGEWKFVYKDRKDTITEVRTFIDGVLIHLNKKNKKEDTLAFVDFPHSQELKMYLINRSNKEDLLNAPVSYHFSDGYPRNSKYLASQQKGSELLEFVMQLVFANEYQYMRKNGLPLGTNRMYYELSPEESEAVRNWAGIEYSLRKTVNEIKDLNPAEYRYTKNDTIERVVSWLKEQDELLRYIQPWNQIILNNDLQYYYRKGQLVDYAEELLAKDTLTTSQDTVIVDYQVTKEARRSFMFYISENFKNRTIYGDSLKHITADLIRKKRKTSRVELQITAIYELKTRLDSLYELKTRNSEIRKVYRHISNELLSGEIEVDYQNLLRFDGPIDKKTAFADTLESRLLKLNQSWKILNDLPQENEIVDSLYTVYKFDPYTFSENIPVRLYKKLYEKVVLDLQSTMLYSASRTADVNKIYGNVQLIQDANERLKELIRLEYEAQKINDRLSRNTSIERLISLLKI